MSAQEIHAHTRPPSPPAPTRRVRALAAHLASYEDIQAQDGSAAMAGANAEVSKTGSTARNGSRGETPRSQRFFSAPLILSSSLYPCLLPLPALQVRKLLIANRGEIALRIIHSTSLSAYSSPDGSLVRFITVAIHTPSEAQALHVLNADDAVQLPAEGPRAYLDRETIVKVAKERGVWGIAPGYGFLR